MAAGTGLKVMALSAGGSDQCGWLSGEPLPVEGVRLTDGVPADMQHLISAHWHNFPPVSPLWHYTLGAACALIFAVSLLGNLTALYLFLRDKSLRTPSNMLIANMTVSDLCMTTNHPVFVYNALAGGAWQLGPRACQAYGFLGAVGGLCSILSLVAISWDRYRVIVLSLRAAPLTRCRALGIIAVIWAYALAFTVLPFLGVGAYVPEGILNSCTIDYLDRSLVNTLYIWSCVVFFFVLPLLAICFFYFHIVNAVRQHESALREQARKMDISALRTNVADKRRSTEVRIAKVALVNISVWAVCWTPYCVVAALGISGYAYLVTPLVSALPALFAKTACTYNPLVYALSHPRYRAALRAHLPCVGGRAGAALPAIRRPSQTVTMTTVSEDLANARQ